MDTDVELVKGDGANENGPGCSGYAMVHSKKVIKHALRQQAKRRRKNTTIAAGNSHTLPRIVVKPLPPPPINEPPSPPTVVANNIHQQFTGPEEPAATMREVLASLPGFSVKSGRRRSTKRLSTAAQLEAGLVDLESPASILASTSLRALLNRHTFQGLPPLYQRKLAQLLPAVDRQDAAISGLNNEFFSRACLEWRKRLAEGEFTPENQQRLKMEAERDKKQLDPWKLKHFEPIWGEKREPKLRSSFHCMPEARTAGAVTRSSLRIRLEASVEQALESTAYHRSLAVADERLEDDNCNVKANSVIEGIDDAISDEHSLELEKLETNINLEMSKEEEEQELEETQEIIELCQGVEDEVDSLSEKEMVHEFVEEHVSLLPCDKFSEIMDEEISEMAQDKSLDSKQLEEELEECVTHLIDDKVPVVTDEQIAAIAEEEVSQLSQISSEQISEASETCDATVYHIPDCDATTSDIEAQIIQGDSIVEDNLLLEDCKVEDQATSVGIAVSESRIAEEMEIDSETLQRIHELEVRGELRDAYEEISGCPEEIIYPILEGMEMAATTPDETEPTGISAQMEDVREQDLDRGNEDEALQDANNYVCSEMLECSWAVEPTTTTVVNSDANISARQTQEELQVPWPLVAAALDGSVAANITVTTHDDCSDTSTTTDSSSTQFVTAESNADSVIHLPVVQTAGPFQGAETLAISAPVTNCLMKSVQSPSPPIIAFPQLQSIRFVQTSFAGQNAVQAVNAPAQLQVQLQNQPQTTTQQVNIVRTQSDEQQLVAHLSAPSNVTCGTVQNSVVAAAAQVQNSLTAVAVQQQSRPQNAIVVQHANARQIVATAQQAQQQQFPTAVAVPTRAPRSSGNGGQRNSRGGNKEQNGGRSRSSTKEPPGAVNLERSYQICQAVIQSSPNRDQLKAHLKPPPSLLARGDGAFTTTKPGGRTVTTVKTQKSQHLQQKQVQGKAQAVMLRHVFATARQTAPVEVADNNAIAQVGSNASSGLGQYILVQRTGVGDGAPRASSAPPLPPQIAGMGVHLVRGRPASAGEGSHQAVTLKARGASDGRGGGAEPGAPGVIMGGAPPMMGEGSSGAGFTGGACMDSMGIRGIRQTNHVHIPTENTARPSQPCECNMRGAMVICRQCGAFCHDDCIGPQRICATCLIR